MQMLKKTPKYCQSLPNMVRVEPLFPTTRGSHFHEISLTITYRGFVRSYIFVPPSRRKCIPMRCGSAMVLPIPQDGFGPLDLSTLMPQGKLRNPLGSGGMRVDDTVNGSIDEEELGDGIVSTLR